MVTNMGARNADILRESDPMIDEKGNGDNAPDNEIDRFKQTNENLIHYDALSNSEDAGQQRQSTQRYQHKRGFRRYHNALKTLNPIGQEDKKDGKPPVDRAGLCSLMIFVWVSRYIYRAYKSGFTPEHWPPLSPIDKSDPNADRLDALWRDELARRGPKNASFGNVTWRFIGTRTIVSTSLYCLGLLCGFIGQMLVMSKLLGHLDSKNEPYTEGIKWAALLTLSEFLRLFLIGWSWAISYRTVIRFRVAGMMLLYRKLTRLNHLGNTTIGELVNLFSTDFVRLIDLVTLTPLAAGTVVVTFCGTWYISKTLGVMALSGIVVFLLFIPVQYGLSRFTGYMRSKVVKISDSRVHLTSEIINCIKLIKMYAWEKRFCDNICDIRKKEQVPVIAINYNHSIGHSLTSTVPVISAIVTFISHVSTGQNLIAAQAFPISAYFVNQMTQALLRVKEGYHGLVDAFIAFKRFKKLLLIEEDPCTVLKPILKSQAIVINLGTFAYSIFSNQRKKGSARREQNRKRVGISSKDEYEEMVSKPASECQTIDVLFDISFEATKGTLVGICGEVGSGKSSLLLAALGQLRVTKGQVMRDGSCAYVSQQAWILNATLRDNILFGEPFNTERYNRALSACSLNHDLGILPGGDETEIGERGINLSGGQKQRIALARALYADRDIYFLDDPLSAVDAHVGLYIFNHLIIEALRDKTVIFVTHQIQYLDRCDVIYMMRDGRIVEHGTHDQLMKMNHRYAFMVNAVSADMAENNTATSDKAITDLPELNAVIGFKINDQSQPESEDSRACVTEKREVGKQKTTLIEAEKSEEGAIKRRTYLAYVSAAGGWFPISMILILTIANVGSSSFSSWWLAAWLNAGGGNVTDPQTNASVWSENINDNPDFFYYQMVYGASLGLIMATNVLRSFVFCKATIGAATTLHNRVFRKILSFPMRFFDTTPLGRIQNLFSRNMDDVDNKLPWALDIVLLNLFTVFAALIVICSIFPWFILPVCLFSASSYLYGRMYRITSRGLTRVAISTHAPILGHVTTTVQGLSTIRAFGKDKEFETKMIKLVEVNCGYCFLQLITHRWLSVRLDGLALGMTCGTMLLVLLTKGQIAPALAGLALMNSVSISYIFQYGIRLISEVEAQFISVERMNSYISLPDSDGDNGKVQVEGSREWPRAGELRFEQVVMAYGKDTPSVLKEVTFAVEPSEKIGIVGRTGSGKSSLTVALFRLVELSAGRITVDGVDISEVGLEQLRSRLSIIPQDPILFSGTIRSNLDPFKVNTDEEVWNALEKTQLKDRVRSIAGQLDARVGFGGDNLSVGERQLLCLARALLRRAKILVLDEATAAVDPETEIAVQNTIQREFVDSTVLTIAHRLQTIVSCDRILVMDDGRVAEFDTPSNLLANENSQFSNMMAAAAKALERH